MKIIRWLQRKTIDPVYVRAGDTIQLIWTEYGTDKTTVLLSESINEPRTIIEVGAFLAEIDGREAICGAFFTDGDVR